MLEPINAKLNLTESEVQATRGIGVRQLRTMRMRGIGPRFIKISGSIGQRGGRVLYPVAELDAWLSQCPGGGVSLLPVSRRI